MKKSLFLIILASLFLVACTSKHHKAVENQTEPTVTESIDPETYMEQQAAAAEAYVEIESEAVAEGDADLCEDIQDENQQYSCKYNVIANLAARKKDPSLCDEIGRKDLIAECIDGTKDR
ncbi:MAG: hypothetical protein AAB373_06820 [Patescibacteria group bacterium]